MRKIELLAPAKNLECGIAAVDHGADAVYIGASKFSARSAAGNSMEDIAKLVEYAHQFKVKIYLAINTILTDLQLKEAEDLIWDAYQIGVDAIIIQDMGILEMNLPPIVIHASTQTDNRTVQKVNFLQDAGFSRVVLARELSLNQIRNISSKTSAELEVFVHGALCVSFSGQCYISEAMTGRSANRGECAQYCRLPYDLTDANGNVILKDQHLLSLKDLDLSNHLEDLLDAGVMSLKIEGRLKDVDYVKNITAFYSQKLNEIISKSDKYERASSGKTRLFFTPNPEKSFRRSQTSYFFNGRQKTIIQRETPKSTGEPIGEVIGIGANYLEIETDKEIHNGDGLSFINGKGELAGFRVNKIDEKKIYPFVLPEISLGTMLNRNFDQVFDQMLHTKTAERKIGLSLVFVEINNGFKIILKDEDGVVSENIFEYEKQLARQPEQVCKNIHTQLSKTGHSVFEINNIDIKIEQMWFFPASVLNEWRRTCIATLTENRKQNYVRELPRKRDYPPFPAKTLDYTGNVTNHLAKQFYESCGVGEIAPGFEVKAQEGVPLMFTKHCIKYEMGWCERYGGKTEHPEPLYIHHKNQHFELRFDCKKCEMEVKSISLSRQK